MTPAKPRMPEANSIALLGSGVVPPVPLEAVPNRVNDSEGIVPSEFSEADDGPEFSSQ